MPLHLKAERTVANEMLRMGVKVIRIWQIDSCVMGSPIHPPPVEVVMGEDLAGCPSHRSSGLCSQRPLWILHTSVQYDFIL